MATPVQDPGACRSHWDDLPPPPEQDEGYHLYEILAAEWMNIGPTPDMPTWAQKVDAELIRKGYMTIDEGGRYRTTAAGRSRASEYHRAEVAWRKEFDRCQLADEAAGLID